MLPCLRMTTLSFMLFVTTRALAVDGFPVVPSGPLKGNRAAGTWKTVSKGKTTTNPNVQFESEFKSTVVVDGWFIETVTTIEGKEASRSMMTTDPEQKHVKTWSFITGNDILAEGDFDETGNLLTCEGVDRYGNKVKTTDRWVDDDHREGSFTLTTAAGAVLMDITSMSVRVKK